MKRVIFALIVGISSNISIVAKEAAPTSLLFMRSLEQELRNPDYVQTILPNNFSYLIQLLDHCKRTRQSRAYVRSVFNLFGNLLKGAEYVNPLAVSDLLEKMPKLLGDHFVPQRSQRILKNKDIYSMNLFDRVQESMAAMMYTKFSSNYDYFSKEPDKFLDELTGQLFEIAQEEITIECLRQSVMRFLETSLSKVIWCPREQQETWESVKKLADQLAALMDDNICDDAEDLDSLYWSLIHRYSYFIDVVGQDLSLACYEKIKYDVAMHDSLLFELEEQADFIETKAERLMRSVMMGEAQRMAIEGVPQKRE